MAGFRFLLILGFICSISVCLSTPVLTYLSDYNVPDVLVNNTDNKPCILAKFDMALGVYYKTVQGDMVNRNIAVPENAIKNGKCNGEFSISYAWSFENDHSGAEKNGVAIAWAKNETIVYINAIVFAISANSLPEPSNAENIIFTAASLKLLPAAYNSSLECKSRELILSTGGSNKINSIIISGKYQIGEFEDYKFITGDRCPKDKETGENSTSQSKSNVGAIAGGTVAALVVLICVASFGLHFYRRNKK